MSERLKRGLELYGPSLKEFMQMKTSKRNHSWESLTEEEAIKDRP